MDLSKVADEYFSSLNSMAARLCDDIKETKEAYVDLWNNLSAAERNEVIDESIIKPEALVKYQENAAQVKEIQDYSTKIIVDESNYSYRDEHSAPFSFKTKSQRDLTTFSEASKSFKKPVKPKLIPTKEVPVSLEAQVDVQSDNSLPKTGLDFLDNW